MAYLQTENINLGIFWRALEMENVGHLEYLTAIWYIYIMAFWYILWSFGIFSPFWNAVPRKIWQPWFQAMYVDKE
jgi:hypothetical protein